MLSALELHSCIMPVGSLSGVYCVPAPPPTPSPHDSGACTNWDFDTLYFGVQCEAFPAALCLGAFNTRGASLAKQHLNFSRLPPNSAYFHMTSLPAAM